MEIDQDIENLSMQLLGKTSSSLTKEEHSTLNRIVKHITVSQNATKIADAEASVWDRLADRVGAIVGSWGFIMTFLLFLLSWALLNTEILVQFKLAFDPYPFTFLNLILSMLAAFQAPIIMMSQNRQSQKDRIAAAHDYQVNLHAELEIMRLHKKMDKLAKQYKEILCEIKQK